MFRYTSKKVLVIFFVAIAALGFNPSTAQADEHPNGTIVTSTNDPSLQFEYIINAAQCDDVNTNDRWTSNLSIANYSATKALTVSITENQEGNIEPSGFGALYAHGNGSTATNVTLNFTFEGLGAESTSFTVTAPEGGCQAPPVEEADDIECVLLNFTPQSAYDEKSGTYAVGTVIKLETLVSGNDAGKVANIVYEGNFDNGAYSLLQRSSNNKYDLLLDKPGHWTVNVLLEDADGHGLHVNRAANCTVYLDSASADEVTPPNTDEPDGTTDGSPETTTPLPNDTTSSSGEVTATTGNAASSGEGTTAPAATQGTASADTLPATGARTTFAFVMGLALLMTGVGFVQLGKPKLSRKLA